MTANNAASFAPSSAPSSALSSRPSSVVRVCAGPMEGITNYLFRSAYHRHFLGIDTYYTPFVTGTHLSKKEKRDICKENNPGMNVVVQVLSNQTDDFLSVARIVSEDFGYDHINLNLGCPSATVTSRKRGAGFLAFPDRLEQFLDEIFERSPISISIKTRIGMHDTSDWESILALYEKYPMTELVIHPRIRDAFYGGLPDLDAFELAYRKSSHPLCYNGNLFHLEDYAQILSRFPKLPAVMIGRGLLINPFLAEEIKQSAGAGAGINAVGFGSIVAAGPANASSPERLIRLRDFEEDLRESLQTNTTGGPHKVLEKMKEVWGFYCYNFENPEKLLKKIRKTQTLEAYQSVIREVFY